ncbi:MAG: hypothetical protein HYU97_08780 [Deltaproteobacteria bacterium]|nr:hypothetical protein [Deltaproteobacteria bacterium]
MKLNIMVVALLCFYLLTSPVRAEDSGCILPKETAVIPLLDAKSLEVKEVFPPKKYLEGKRLTESLLMKDGTKIIYEVGGCAHYSFSFTYENIKGLFPTNKKTVLEKALGLLQKTPILKGSNAPNKNILERALIRAQTSDHKIENKILSLPCGDAICALEIKEPSALIISYDFAL